MRLSTMGGGRGGSFCFSFFFIFIFSTFKLFRCLFCFLCCFARGAGAYIGVGCLSVRVQGTSMAFLSELHFLSDTPSGEALKPLTALKMLRLEIMGETLCFDLVLLEFDRLCSCGC